MIRCNKPFCSTGEKTLTEPLRIRNAVDPLEPCSKTCGKIYTSRQSDSTTAGRQADRQTGDRQANKETDTTDRQIDRHDRQIGRQAGRQAGKQRDRHDR